MPLITTLRATVGGSTAAVDERSSLYMLVEDTQQGACMRRTFVDVSILLSGVSFVVALLTHALDLQHQIASIDEARQRHQRFEDQV